MSHVTNYEISSQPDFVSLKDFSVDHAHHEGIKNNRDEKLMILKRASNWTTLNIKITLKVFFFFFRFCDLWMEINFKWPFLLGIQSTNKIPNVKPFNFEAQ